jgi:hypothetical protein
LGVSVAVLFKKMPKEGVKRGTGDGDTNTVSRW